MFDHLTDLDALLQYAEELLETLSTDGRYIMYVRDLSRIVSWLRSQSNGRVIVIGAVAAAALAAVLISSRRSGGDSGFSFSAPLDRSW
jgi:hypothetical protein